jgi:hypothetical protein
MPAVAACISPAVLRVREERFLHIPDLPFLLAVSVAFYADERARVLWDGAVPSCQASC